MDTLLFALWFFLPAGLANAAPPLANKIPWLEKLNIPVDGNKTFRGKRIFGDHKTLRGFVVGTLVGVLVVALQILLASNIDWFANLSDSVDYRDIATIFLGALLGFGALFGDALESFLKRQLNIKSGDSLFVLDQIDYILGGLLFSALFVSLSAYDYLTILLVWGLLHPVGSTLGWLLKLKDKPF